MPITPPQQVQPGMGPDTPVPSVPPVPSGPSGGITGPSAGAELRGTVSGQGICPATPHFANGSWTLLIDGVGETFLALGETPAEERAELFAWDTTRYPNGKHVLRLRVVYEGMNYDEYSVPVTIANRT